MGFSQDKGMYHDMIIVECEGFNDFYFHGLCSAYG
jgi:hypothetical protein